MINGKKIVSVVVPIYNTKNYLTESINSIIVQTYNNLEIILVDDGSTDGSSELCDSFKKKDKRIKVIHKPNGGLSDARNTGLNSSTGYYVLFVDSDDRIDKLMVQSLIENMEMYDTDVSVCAYEKFSNYLEIQEANKNIIDGYCVDGKTFTEEAYKGYYKNIGFVAWNKVYKKSLFLDNNISYPVGRFYEDTFTTYKLLYNSNKIAVTNTVLYYYRNRNDGITKSPITLRKTIDYIAADKSSVDYFINISNYNLAKAAADVFFKEQIKLYIRIQSTTKDNTCINYLINEYRKTYNEYTLILNFSVLKSIFYGIFGKYPKHLSKLIRIFKN